MFLEMVFCDLPFFSGMLLPHGIMPCAPVPPRPIMPEPSDGIFALGRLPNAGAAFLEAATGLLRVLFFLGGVRWFFFFMESFTVRCSWHL